MTISGKAKRRATLSQSGRAVVVLGSILIAAVLTMTAYEIWRQREDTVSSVGGSLESLSLALAEQTERSFQSVSLILTATIESVGRAESLDAISTHAFHQALKDRISGVPLVSGVAVIDSDGRIVSAARIFPPPEESVTDREYFRYHRANRDTAPHIGTPVVSPVDGRRVLPVSRRLNNPDGSFAGVVLAAVDPAYFEAIAARVLPDEGGAFALFRADATLLARHPLIPGAIGKSFAHLPAFEAKNDDKGSSWGVSPIDGSVRIVSYNQLSGLPLMVIVSVDERILLNDWRGNALRLTAAALLAAAILALAVTFLVRQMTREEHQAVALRQSEERLRFARFALDHAADMVFWIDHTGRILYANDVACERLGHGADDLPPIGIIDINPELGGHDTWEDLLTEARLQHHLRFDTACHMAGDVTCPVEVSLNHVTFGGDEYLCMFARDITERRKAEAALAEKTASLEASNAELEQFAYVASHDLREPLRMVNSFVSLLARRYSDKLDKEGLEFIAFAQDGAVRMDRLILDLLEYSRVGRLDRPFCAVSLNAIAETAAHGLTVAAREARATIDIAPDMPIVFGNEEELLRLYLNLVGNAIKYRHSNRAPIVAISAERQGDEVLCRVSDNGIGIASEYFERVFRIFQRLHGRDKYEGTGIGLAICKKIVEHHGGRIWIESTLDEGTTLFFTLKAR